jgi:hypothetical protein
MFSFSKNKEKKAGPSIVESIKSFAPMIKSITGLDIESIAPMFLDGINEAKKRTGKEIMFMVTTTDECFTITIYEANTEAQQMTPIYCTKFLSTIAAIDEFSKLSEFLKTYTPQNAIDTNTTNSGAVNTESESTNSGADTTTNATSDGNGAESESTNTE